jgi:lipopolysaccharide/colanic/teichoic acid biosynthesis glycosyltransferase
VQRFTASECLDDLFLRRSHELDMLTGWIGQRHNPSLDSIIHLALGALICVMLPFLIVTWHLPQTWHEPEARHTTAAASGALFLGFWLQRNVGQLPGTRESSGILPGYTLSFGLVLVTILMARMAYSRAILASAYGLSLVWFFAAYMVTQRQRRLTLAIVEGGHVDVLTKLPGVICHRLALADWPIKADAVVADLREDHSPQWTSRLADYALAGIPVYHSKDLYESLTGRAELEHLSENNLGALAPQNSLLLAKTMVDRLAALPALLLLAIPMLLVAIAIRIDSPGPALFLQRRVGFRGREFTVFKFRTMFAGAQGSDISQFMTRRADPRITRLGIILRRCRIDELPQIFNILRGEMSWIGPRPEAALLSQWYESEIPFYRYRSVVRPGITGWAQVNQGHVAEVGDVHTKLQFDFYYIRHFSVWLDMLIVAKTVKTMLTGFGSR